jgi:hypothetical protein
MRRSMKALVVSPLSVLSVVTALLITGPTATARPLPGEGPERHYPVNQILRRATDHCGRDAVLRRGYFNKSTGAGFGFDKMYHKHNLKRTGVFAYIIRNPNCGSPQSDTTRRYEAYAHLISCGLLSCEVAEIRRVFLVVNYRNDPKIPGQKGVITAFCENQVRCADWVDRSINLPLAGGKNQHASWAYKPLSKEHKYKPGEVPPLS